MKSFARPDNALKAHALLGGGAFLPVHWGTFSLALHDWDQPAEALYEKGRQSGVRLVMPRPGEPVEPAQVDEAMPWWREVDANRATDSPADAASTTTLPKSMPWPAD